MSEALDSVECQVLKNLITNEDYFRRVIPFVKDEYFQDNINKVVFNVFKKYTTKYTSMPSKDALLIELEQHPKISDKEFASAKVYVKEYCADKTSTDLDYLISTTEKWCQDSAFFNVLIQASETIQDDKAKVSKSDIPEKMRDALSISFDLNVGIDLFEDAEKRYELYNLKEDRIKFGLDILNKITKGGLPRKTLTVLMSSNTGGFKTGTKCHLSVDFARLGYNVLYLTMEMAEERIAERLDANMLEVNIDDLSNLPKMTFCQSVSNLKKKHQGRIIIKQFPTGAATVNHFRFLLKELKIKKNFKPDIIMVDYLNICASARLPPSAATSTYLWNKSIAEELRAFAIETNTAVITSTQSGRQAAGSSDVDIGDVSESYGVPQTADIFLAIVTTEQLDHLNQIMYKQLKNRFGDININRTFNLGVNKPQMRLYALSSNHDDVVSGPLKQTFSMGTEQSKNKKFNDFKFDETEDMEDKPF